MNSAGVAFVRDRKHPRSNVIVRNGLFLDGMLRNRWICLLSSRLSFLRLILRCGSDSIQRIVFPILIFDGARCCSARLIDWKNSSRTLSRINNKSVDLVDPIILTSFTFVCYEVVKMSLESELERFVGNLEFSI